MLDGIDGFEYGMSAYLALQMAQAPTNWDASHWVLPWSAGLSLVAPTVGEPDGSGFSHQTTPFTCDVVSQQMILNQFGVVNPDTGHPFSEHELMDTAQSHGWLDEHGTTMPDMGRLLGHYSIPYHFGRGWNQLVRELSSGHQVIVGVNADPLWKEGGKFFSLDNLHTYAPNHAVVLKGLTVTSSGDVKVVINDPGREDGAGSAYPLHQFQSGLDARHFQFVATDTSPSRMLHLPVFPHDRLSSFVAKGMDVDSHTELAWSYASDISLMTEDERLRFIREI